MMSGSRSTSFESCCAPISATEKRAGKRPSRRNCKMVSRSPSDAPMRPMMAQEEKGPPPRRSAGQVQAGNALARREHSLARRPAAIVAHRRSGGGPKMAKKKKRLRIALIGYGAISQTLLDLFRKKKPPIDI